jgi:microcystin-dependent protein
MMLGEIRRLYVYGQLDGLAECAGQTLSVESNLGLFSIIFNRYGGDGVTTFQLPTLPVDSGPKWYIATRGIFPSFT